nr:hypothetical protein [Tanacetum cinerariifolium]
MERVSVLRLRHLICSPATAPNCFLLFAYAKMDLFAFIRHADPTKVRIGERQIEEGQTPLLDFTRVRVVSLVVGGDQVRSSVPADHGDHNHDVDNIGTHDLNKEGDDEIQGVVVDKPKGTKRKRKDVVGSSGSNLPPKKLREYYDACGDGGASTAGQSLGALWGLLDRSTLAAKVGVTAMTTVPFVTSFVTPTPEHEGDGHTDSVFGPNLSPVPLPLVMIATVTTTAIVGATSTSVHRACTKLVHCSIFRDSASPSAAEADFAGPSHHADAEKLERKCNMQADLLKDKDAKITNLKAQLSLKEAEAAELSFDELSLKAVSFESQIDNLAHQVKVLSDLVAELDSELMGMAIHLNEKFYHCFLTTIADRRWILSRAIRLVVIKCLQSPEYIAAMGEAIGRDVDKVDPLSFENLAGEASTLGVPKTVTVTTALSTTFAHTSFVPPISVADYGVLDAEPQPEASHSRKIIFEQETLETSPEHPATS